MSRTQPLSGDTTHRGLISVSVPELVCSFGANGLILRLRVDEHGFGRHGSPSRVWPKAPLHW